MDDDYIESVYDGELFKEVRAKYADRDGEIALHQFLAWKMSNDPCTLGEENKSWLPVLFVCQSLPPWMQGALGAMHLGMFLPPGIKNLTLLMPYFLRLHGDRMVYLHVYNIVSLLYVFISF